MVVISNMRCATHQLEPRMVAAMVAWRKGLTIHTRDLMHIVMNVVMSDFVNTGQRNFVAWFVDSALNFFDSGHLALLGNGEPWLTAGCDPISNGSPSQACPASGSQRRGAVFWGRWVCKTQRPFSCLRWKLDGNDTEINR